jgi:hypothetical protein
MVLAQKHRHVDKWKRKLRNKPTEFLIKVVKTYDREKIASSTNVCGKTKYQHNEE